MKKGHAYSHQFVVVGVRCFCAVVVCLREWQQLGGRRGQHHLVAGEMPVTVVVPVVVVCVCVRKEMKTKRHKKRLLHSSKTTNSLHKSATTPYYSSSLPSSPLLLSFTLHTLFYALRHF